MDIVILMFLFMVSMSAIGIFLVSSGLEGTKGIEREPYYGRKTGTIYTAKKERSEHLL